MYYTLRFNGCLNKKQTTSKRNTKNDGNAAMKLTNQKLPNGTKSIDVFYLKAIDFENFLHYNPIKIKNEHLNDRNAY